MTDPVNDHAATRLSRAQMRSQDQSTLHAISVVENPEAVYRSSVG